MQIASVFGTVFILSLELQNETVWYDPRILETGFLWSIHIPLPFIAVIKLPVVVILE